MKRITTTTLAVKFWGTIETPPLQNRENFRQGVIDTILNVLKLEEVTIEYIGYKPDRVGETDIHSLHMIYQDCVFVSLGLHSLSIQQDDERQQKIIEDFIKVFEDKTHKHLMVDSTIFNKTKQKQEVELVSDWKYYLKQG